jgi:2',3'-cyclic-nucleotide 2'-phosphodiesterase
MIKILFLGDIYGKPGRKVVSELLPKIKEEENIDVVIANGENLAGGFGITEKTATHMFHCGVDVFTSGNHLWDNKDGMDFIAENQKILRPANYPPGTPGNDFFLVKTKNDFTIGVLSLMGRTFTINVDCPFRVARKYIKKIKNFTNVIFVDFHAEATAEKKALGWYLDGDVSAVIGTHTHVQTADERILPNGTAYLTDAGMNGSQDSVIGLRISDAIERMIEKIPNQFHVAKENLYLQGVIIEVEEQTGKSVSIKRLSIPLDERKIEIK